MDIAKQLHSIMALDHSALAIEQEGNRYSWGHVASWVDAIDQALSAANITAGAPVGLLLKNRPAMTAALLTMLATERCIVSLSPARGMRDLAEEIEELRLPAIIAPSEDWDKPQLKQAASAVGSIAIAVGEKELTGKVQLVNGLEQADPGRQREPTPGVAIDMLTSGTTGKPKRIQLFRKALEKSIEGLTHYKPHTSEEPRLKPGVTLVSFPIVHIGGMYYVITAAVDGRAISLLERFSVDGWLNAVRRHRPKVTGLVPSAIKMVLDAEIEPEDLESLVAINAGSAPLAPDIQEAFEDRYNIPILITYGATEFAGSVAGWSMKDHQAHINTKRGSVGRAHPGCELRIADTESGTILPTNQSGILEVRTTQAGHNDWIRTSDRARLDADGFLWIEGRADGAINRGGFKIDPDSVAQSIEQHPAVREAAVVGLNDERLGQVPVAVVELGEEQTATCKELLDFATEKMPRYHVPVRLLIVDKIPRTPSLKPSHPRIRELFSRSD